MEYINIGDIKKSATIGMTSTRGIAWADDTASVSPDCFTIPFLEIIFSECAGRLWMDWLDRVTAWFLKTISFWDNSSCKASNICFLAKLLSNSITLSSRLCL